MLWALLIALVSAVIVWSIFLKLVPMETDAVSPEIPRHSRVLFYRLARSFEPGDIVAYRHGDGRLMLARVVEFDKAARRIKVDRNDSEPQSIALSDVVGRAIWNTR
jgi:hypothetical protein